LFGLIVFIVWLPLLIIFWPLYFLFSPLTALIVILQIHCGVPPGTTRGGNVCDIFDKQIKNTISELLSSMSDHHIDPLRVDNEAMDKIMSSFKDMMMDHSMVLENLNSVVRASVASYSLGQGPAANQVEKNPEDNPLLYIVLVPIIIVMMIINIALWILLWPIIIPLYVCGIECGAFNKDATGTGGSICDICDKLTPF
jgi:hypothetical protein